MNPPILFLVKREILFFSTALIIAVEMMGCTRASPTTSSSEITVGLGNRPTTLDPRLATDANSERITDLIFHSIARIDRQLKTVPYGVKSWRLYGNKIDLTLDTSLRFHDGTPVTAPDILFSFHQYMKPESPFAAQFETIDNVVAQGDHVVLSLKKPDGALLTNLAYVKILKKSDFPEKMLQGTGPYALASHDLNNVILEKVLSSQQNNRSKSTEPAPRKIIFKMVLDDNTRFLKMLHGDLDVLLNELPEEKVLELKQTGRFQVIITPGLNFNYLLLNFKNPLIKNLQFRRALLSSIPRDDIVTYKFENLAQVATSILAPINPFAKKDLKLETLPSEKIKNWVMRQGWNKISLSLKSSDQGSSNGEFIAGELRQNGFNIIFQNYEWGTYYNDVKNGLFDLALMRWVGVVDPDIYRESLSSDEFPPGKNRGRYDNKTFDKIVTAARFTFDEKARKKLYDQAQEIFVDDLPVIPLWYNSNISVLSWRIKNFEPMPTGSFYSLLDVTKE